VWIRREYPYLYPLADCNGNFELDIPVILGKLKANRPDLSIRKLELVFDTFKKEGLAFVWEVHSRQYVHWTRSERRGRLPQPSHRTNKYERKLAPPYPKEEYAEYLQQFGELVDVADSTGLATVRAKATATARATDKAKETPLLGFDEFWNTYPRKVGKPSAQKAWGRVLKTIQTLESETLMDRIFAGLDLWKQTEQWQKEGGKFIPYPATFLNQRRWEDDPLSSTEQAGFYVGRPRTEGQPGKCSECGTEIPAGFLKCLKCIKKKAPVNP